MDFAEICVDRYYQKWGVHKNLSFSVSAFTCWHVFLCYILKHKDAVISSGSILDELPVVLFRGGCHSCRIISVRQRQQCLVDKAWMSLRAQWPRGSSRLPVCSSTRTRAHTHTHTHTALALTHTLSLSVYLSSHTHTYVYTHILTCTYYHTHVHRPPGLSSSDTGSVPAM